MGCKQIIELHGKTKIVLHKDESKMLVLFAEVNAGNMILTIPMSSIMYRTLKLHKYYNVLVELKGISRLTNGKVHTENALVVKKLIKDVG